MWYTYDTYQSGEEFSVRKATGAFVNGALCGAVAATVIPIIATAAITATGATGISAPIVGGVSAAGVAGTTNSFSGVIESIIIGEEITIEQVASDFAIGALTANIPKVDLLGGIIISNSLCVNKYWVSNRMNYYSDNLIEWIEKEVTIPIEDKAPPITKFNPREDYWW